jgi:peptidoglycan hydrolase CwlO-like protein
MLKSIWNKFKSLKWWQKILAFIPFILAIIVTYLFLFANRENINKRLLELNENRVDRDIRDFNSSEEESQRELEELERERKEVLEERKTIEEKLREKEEETNDLFKKIDSVNPSIDDINNLFDGLRRK